MNCCDTHSPYRRRIQPVHVIQQIWHVCGSGPVTNAPDRKVGGVGSVLSREPELDGRGFQHSLEPCKFRRALDTNPEDPGRARTRKVTQFPDLDLHWASGGCYGRKDLLHLFMASRRKVYVPADLKYIRWLCTGS